MLQQKFPAETYDVITRLEFFPNPKLVNERSGLVIMGLNYAGLALRSKANGLQLIYIKATSADKGNEEKEMLVLDNAPSNLYLKVSVNKGAECSFSYSTDGKNFVDAGETFQAEPGRWKGAKFGIFASREGKTNDAGYAEVDWVRVDGSLR